ncbi:hypothetical protein C6Y14_35025 [Streptomyces dioscori]|uniref:Uncharacterized protein n=1 Tax=Streptomyces dioscori TaxID=2109333 RepID=A0A2P8PXR2_9ACTN|nr:hypothetical protein [Streptomyces dioscori]PSM38788.1 hypothetical protein C6Y14_35025 [Streptomyces dioscori]
MSEAPGNITTADLDDLVERMREAGQDTTEGEELRAAFAQLDEMSRAQAAGFKRRLVVAALRYGGKALAWLVRHFSEQAAEYVLRHALQLADFLERAESWAVEKIAQFLQGCGVPGNLALEIARVIMAIVG